ncbi:5'-adenylylsulfate reductase-like 5 isoform X2 [Musa acuminata AAA Group]|uniref:5'-adenylylsulfate reductase-like 5 isoform X2 n=1 Tax=Musa acuminata AAA Group TaxID=214697 RepID=UPI0031DAE325
MDAVFFLVLVSGEMLERELSNDQSAYYSVLFYASWCQFSSDIQPIFDALSYMFPQIKHLLIEESSVMPSVLSRNGIHSFPAIMLFNGTTRFRYRGSKDFTSLVHFYKRSTGLDPITYLEIHQSSSGNARTVIVQVESIWELITKESYLTFAILFICLKIIMCFFPLIYLRFKSFWVSHVWPVNLRILHESSLLLEKVLQVVDIKRMWSNIQLSNKTRNFQKGANNARVWASSLTRLNESSSSRLALKDS